ncbi:MAG: FecR family protein [Coraliomargarita sp.]
MKYNRFSTLLCGLFLLAAITSNAAELASAKVLSVTGTVTKYAADGSESPLAQGDILKQGDGITTAVLSTATLVFSNGSDIIVEENSSVTIKELSQKPFGGNKSYEQLSADPSQSQALLELNYGKLNGHVKQLRSGSNFHIETPLGTAAIRGTRFFVGLRYNTITGDMMLSIKNLDGLVDALSRYAGSVDYGRGGMGDKTYDAGITNDSVEAIPPGNTLVVRFNVNDPNFDDIVDRLKNFPPVDDLPPLLDDPKNQDDYTPDDEGIIIVSPSGPEVPN